MSACGTRLCAGALGLLLVVGSACANSTLQVEHAGVPVRMLRLDYNNIFIVGAAAPYLMIDAGLPLVQLSQSRESFVQIQEIELWPVRDR